MAIATKDFVALIKLFELQGSRPTILHCAQLQIVFKLIVENLFYRFGIDSLQRATEMPNKKCTKNRKNFPRPVIKAMLDMQFRYFLWSNTQVPPQGDTSTEEEEDDNDDNADGAIRDDTRDVGDGADADDNAANGDRVQA